MPHLYNGRGKTYYFGQYQGFRQVLGTTQVLPVPSAAQRPADGCTANCVVDDTVTYKLADGSSTTDVLYVPVDPAMIPILNRYPKANLPSGAYGDNTYAPPPRSSPTPTSSRSASTTPLHPRPVPRPLQLQQPDRTHHQPRPNRHRPHLLDHLHRSPAQRLRLLDAHRDASPHLRVAHRHHPQHAGISDRRSRRSGGEVQRRAL
jgi:hypothetical protein